MKLQSAVKKETVAVAVGTGVGCLLLIAVFLIFYLIFPESSVKFDYRVVLGALVGGAVAVANFFLMAVTVQNVVNVKNQDDALRMMHASYRNRMLMRVIWIIIAIFAPCFNYAAGIIPLFIPGFVIKIRGSMLGVTGKTAAGAEGASGAAGEDSQEPTDHLQETAETSEEESEAKPPEGMSEAKPPKGMSEAKPLEDMSEAGTSD